MKFRGRLLLLAANGLLALGLGFLIVEGEAGRALVKSGGWWLMAATVAVWGWALAKVAAGISWTWGRERREWAALGVVPVGWVLLLVHEPARFKIIMDEIMLLGTSMSLHFDRLVQVPIRGHDLAGAFVIAEGFVDKRPYFFPFLLSLVHDVAGYRPANAFVLNGLLAGAFLAMVYLLGRRLAGRGAAVAGVLWCSGWPLLAQAATGGGFDLLNLCMIALTLGLALRFARTAGRWELTALCFSTVLLAQVRYESAAYVVPCVLVVLGVWWRHGRLELSWPVVATPWLLLPVPWVLGSFQAHASAWETASQPGATAPLAITHVAGNLRHAAGFFFDVTGVQPNSLLFSTVGGLALILLLGRVGGWVARRGRPALPMEAGVLIFIGALFAHFLLLLAYFWGKLDDPIISRLSLPTHLLLLLAIWSVVPRGAPGRRLWLGLAGLAVVQLWSRSIPTMATHAATLQNVHAQEVEWRQTFLAPRLGANLLVIDPYSIVWLTLKVSSTTPAQARLQPEAIAHHLRARSFQEILVFQRFEVDPATGHPQVRGEFDVGPAFVLEPVAERRLQPYTVSRISRVVAVKP